MTGLKEMNGKHYLKAEVFILPTKGEAPIQKQNNFLYFSKKIKNLSKTQDCFVPHHMYFVVNDEIKEGEWCHNFGEIFQCKTNEHKGIFQKIVATTNKSLLFPEITFEDWDGKSRNIPHPSNEFIEKYISEHDNDNEIKSVLIEYKQNWKEHKYKDHHSIEATTWSPNVNLNDNTITIKKTKDVWNMEEHCVDMQYYMEYCKSNKYVTPMDWINNYKHY